VPRAEAFGFKPKSEPSPSLKAHQVDIARWMTFGGRRACFAAFGLGKTRTHLQVAKWVTEETNKPHLIIAPLGVRQEFTKVEGPAMGLDIPYCRNDAEIQGAGAPIIITNYERVRDGAITIDDRSPASAWMKLLFCAHSAAKLISNFSRCLRRSNIGMYSPPHHHPTNIKN
jgi:hypothetical protein